MCTEKARPPDSGAELRLRKARDQLGRFVVRLRIVAAHSLAADRQRLVDLCEHSWTLKRTQDADGNDTVALEPIPFLPVEQVESAVARLRPLLLKQDGISYTQVLGALGENLTTDERKELALYKSQFEEFDPDAKQGKPKAPHVVGEAIPNTRIGGAWLYGDLVHADTIRQSYTAQVSPEATFLEAQRMTCGLMLAALQTLDFLQLLHEQRRIAVSSDTFTRHVTVTSSSWAPEVSAVYSADEGTPLPTSFEQQLGEDWLRLH